MKQPKKIFTRMLINNWGGISHKMLEPNVSNSVFAYIVPFQTYDTTSGMEANRYFWQIATVFAAALIINAIVIRKNGWKEV